MYIKYNFFKQIQVYKHTHICVYVCMSECVCVYIKAHKFKI